MAGGQDQRGSQMRNRVGALAALGLAAGMLGTGARAQGRFPNGPTPGTRTISVSGSYTGGPGASVGGINLQLGLYTTQSLELGLTGSVAAGRSRATAGRADVTAQSRPRLAGLGGSVAGGSTNSHGFAGVNFRYHFGRPRIVPYVGLGANALIGSLGARSNAGRVNVIGTVGADFFVEPQQSVFLEINALRAASEGSGTEVGANFGLKYFF